MHSIDRRSAFSRFANEGQANAAAAKAARQAQEKKRAQACKASQEVTRQQLMRRQGLDTDAR